MRLDGRGCRLPRGVSTMVANTGRKAVAAFADHETNLSADNLGNAGGLGNCALAKRRGVVTAFGTWPVLPGR